MEKRISWHYNSDALSAMQQKLQPFVISDNIAQNHLGSLDEDERSEYSKMVETAIEALNSEHTRLMGLIGVLTRMPAKQLEWENNHLKIKKAVTSLLSLTGTAPNQMQIARATGLDRKTVKAHLAKGDDSSVFAEHQSIYTLMATQVMDMVLEEAVLEHNIKAAKMYFDILEKLKTNGPSAIYNTTNNYIQINNTIIKQEVIGLLAPEQLRKIEELLAEWLPLDPHESIFGPNVPPVGFTKP